MRQTLSELAFDEDDALTVAVGVTYVAQMAARREQDTDRKSRKEAAIAQKLQVLEKAGLGMDAVQLKSRFKDRVSRWSSHKRSALLVELAFASPFAPYELKVTDKHLTWALGRAASVLGLTAARVAEIQDAIRSARKVHRHIAWGKIGVSAVVGALVFAVGGFALAPVLAGALGSAAGLSGAAAISHGLALLGGGSLALGGTGMAGGLIAVTAGGGAVGGAGLGGAVALWNAGYAAAVTELVKLQVSYREVLLRAQLREGEAASVIERLNAQIEALNKQLETERGLNDPGAKRIEEMERIERAYRDALAWMKRPGAEA